LTTQHLLEPHNHLFDGDGVLKLESDYFPPLTGLMMGLLFEEQILQLSDALQNPLTRIVELESSRTKAQLWLPNRLMGLARWIFRRDGAEDQIAVPDMRDSESPQRTDAEKITLTEKFTARKDSNSAHDQSISMRTPNVVGEARAATSC
jgi:hypothetical protein